MESWSSWWGHTFIVNSFQTNCPWKYLFSFFFISWNGITHKRSTVQCTCTRIQYLDKFWISIFLHVLKRQYCIYADQLARSPFLSLANLSKQKKRLEAKEYTKGKKKIFKWDRFIRQILNLIKSIENARLW